jgi:golgi to ER traffic protein 4
LTKCNFPEREEFEKWIHKVASVIEKIEPHVVERETLIVKAIKWSSGVTNQKNPLMHKLIARIMAKENNYEQAR